MYLFLLVFGAVLSVAGVVLAASGLSVHDHSFDPTLVTPGFVAIVGGLLLIGLGFALRVLQRIEQALATRPPMPRATRIAEPAEAPQHAAAAARAAERTGAHSFPAEDHTPAADRAGWRAGSAYAPPPKSGGRTAAKISEHCARSDRRRSKRSSPRRARSRRSRSMTAEESPAENVGPFVPRAVKARNGAAPAPRISTRLDASARAPLRPNGRKSPAFDALWPKGPRPRRAAAQAAPGTCQKSPPSRRRPSSRSRASSPLDSRAPEEAAEPVTVLKSGVVDGMAYTLYSDGSIEAQLPQGLLRFGSIAELRAHIEQDSLKLADTELYS